MTDFASASPVDDKKRTVTPIPASHLDVTLQGAREFSYSKRNRSGYLQMIVAFGFICLIECGLVALIVDLLIPFLWLKLVLNFMHFSLCLFALVVVAMSLKTQHKLTSSELQLNYGMSLHQSIPLTAIQKMSIIHKTTSRINPTRHSYDATKQRLVVCSSKNGMLLLTLKEPQILKIGWRPQVVTNILLNLDRRDEFIAALRPYLSEA